MKTAINTKRILATACVCLCFATGHGVALAVDASAVPAEKQTKAGLYLDAGEAYDFLRKAGDRAYFVDVRTRAEVSFLGMPTVADANIPYVDLAEDASWDDKNGRFKLETNGDFGPELARRLSARGLSKTDPIVLMCRSGDRSARAANLLKELGYQRVYSVVDGFEGDLAKDGPKAGQRVVNGWKNAGLPWSYKLDGNKMYFPRY
jgi:rhodanese-related sulfurtransferase